MKLRLPFVTLLAALASLSVARAQIIYSGPQNIAINSATAPDATPFKIDFNTDGIPDFKLFFRGPTPQLIMVGGLNNGAYAGASSIVTDLITAGQAIDASRTWWTPGLEGDLNFTIGPNAFGPFNGQRGFIGARFSVGINNFYGWVDYAGTLGSPSGTVFGWAYESTPNKGIAAGALPAAVPEPSTYGAVAAGVLVGLGMLRRRKR